MHRRTSNIVFVGLLTAVAVFVVGIVAIVEVTRIGNAVLRLPTTYQSELFPNCSLCMGVDTLKRLLDKRCARYPRCCCCE